MKDKVVVITGASSGIGAALAIEVASRGGHPVLVARREAELNRIAEQCSGRALALPADVTRRDQVHGVAQKAIARFGHIDVWVNNAGRGISRAVSELTDQDFDEMMLVNVKSALYGMQAVLPHFKERQQGHVVNVSSLLGRLPFATFRSAYNAAKHALNALTANLRIELKRIRPSPSPW